MGCHNSKATLNVEMPTTPRTSSKRRLDIAQHQAVKSSRSECARVEAAKAEAAAKAAAKAKAEAQAATEIQRIHRGGMGRDKAARTCPPCVEACKRFVIDKSASEFGTCVCGFKKEGHSKRALAQGSGRLKKVGSAELRKKMVQREMADCLEFRVNMDPSLPFGTCMCGRPRAEHTAAALAVKGGMGTTRADSAELRKKMVQREKADCPVFRLNMDPRVPFGTCMCGRPKAEHTEAALAAEAGPKALVKKHSSDVRREMEAKQERVEGSALETHGAKTGVAFGLGNTVRTAAEEEAAVRAAINARAGGADKAAALEEFNEMMKDAENNSI